MTFEILWPLIFAVAVPIIILLYLLRPKGTRKVAEGVLAADWIWGEHGDLNKIPGLTDMVEGFLNDIQSKGMLETVKSIL